MGPVSPAAPWERQRDPSLSAPAHLTLLTSRYPPGPLPACPTSLLGLHAGLPSLMWSNHTSRCPCWGPSSATGRKKRRTGPGNRWKSGIPAPNPAPIMHPGPRGPAGKGGPGARDQEKGEERQSFQPPGSGMLCLCGGGRQAYLGSHHSWGARGAGLPLEALREKEERLVGTHSLAWTRHGPQAPGSPPSPWPQPELNWDGGHSTRRPLLGGLPDRTGGRGDLRAPGRHSPLLLSGLGVPAARPSQGGPGRGSEVR